MTNTRGRRLTPLALAAAFMLTAAAVLGMGAPVSARNSDVASCSGRGSGAGEDDPGTFGYLPYGGAALDAYKQTANQIAGRLTGCPTVPPGPGEAHTPPASSRRRRPLHDGSSASPDREATADVPTVLSARHRDGRDGSRGGASVGAGTGHRDLKPGRDGRTQPPGEAMRTMAVAAAGPASGPAASGAMHTMATTAPLVTDVVLSYYVYQAPYQVLSNDTFQSLLARMEASPVLCAQHNITSLWVGDTELPCQFTASSTAWNITTEFTLTAPRSIRFRNHMDFGAGGAAQLDGDLLYLRTDDQYWFSAWEYGMYTPWRTFAAGRHTYQVLGYEDCCGTNVAFQFQVDESAPSAWLSLTTSNFEAEVNTPAYTGAPVGVWLNRSKVGLVWFDILFGPNANWQAHSLRASGTPYNASDPIGWTGPNTDTVTGGNQYHLLWRVNVDGTVQNYMRSLQQSGACLTVAGGVVQDGAIVGMADCEPGNQLQLWDMPAVPAESLWPASNRSTTPEELQNLSHLRPRSNPALCASVTADLERTYGVGITSAVVVLKPCDGSGAPYFPLQINRWAAECLNGGYRVPAPPDAVTLGDKVCGCLYNYRGPLCEYPYEPTRKCALVVSTPSVPFDCAKGAEYYPDYQFALDGDPPCRVVEDTAPTEAAPASVTVNATYWCWADLTFTIPKTSFIFGLGVTQAAAGAARTAQVALFAGEFDLYNHTVSTRLRTPYAGYFFVNDEGGYAVEEAPEPLLVQYRVIDYYRMSSALVRNASLPDKGYMAGATVAAFAVSFADLRGDRRTIDGRASLEVALVSHSGGDAHYVLAQHISLDFPGDRARRQAAPPNLQPLWVTLGVMGVVALAVGWWSYKAVRSYRAARVDRKPKS